MTCDMCGGSLQHLGVLGNLEHVCCRDCGMMYYTELTEGDLEEMEDE